MMNEKERLYFDSLMELAESLGHSNQNPLSLSLLCLGHGISFEQVSDELIEDFNIQDGMFDTVNECRYEVPSVTSIGMLYQELVLAIMPEEDAAQGIIDIFSSFITDEISDFNSNVYYTNPDYLRCSYLEGRMLA